MVNCRCLDSVLVEAILGRFEPHTLASPECLLPTCSPDIVLASAFIILTVRALLYAIVSFMFICNCSLRMRYLLNTLKHFKHAYKAIAGSDQMRCVHGQALIFNRCLGYFNSCRYNILL